jgi:hypothetical protein
MLQHGFVLLRKRVVVLLLGSMALPWIFLSTLNPGRPVERRIGSFMPVRSMVALRSPALAPSMGQRFQTTTFVTLRPPKRLTFTAEAPRTVVTGDPSPTPSKERFTFQFDSDSLKPVRDVGEFPNARIIDRSVSAALDDSAAEASVVVALVDGARIFVPNFPDLNAGAVVWTRLAFYRTVPLRSEHPSTFFEPCCAQLTEGYGYLDRQRHLLRQRPVTFPRQACQHCNCQTPNQFLLIVMIAKLQAITHVKKI